MPHVPSGVGNWVVFPRQAMVSVLCWVQGSTLCRSQIWRHL